MSWDPTSASGPPQPPVSVCPRHPDRESYVLCQRCGRPACPACQVSAAVGIQCVDCVREGAASVRQPRTRAGAVVRGGRPVLTYALIGLCVVMFLAQVTSTLVTFRFAFIPLFAQIEPWRYLTSALLHDPTGLPLHLLLNMYCLYLLGPPLEQHLGRGRYVALLLVTALASSVAFEVIEGADSRAVVLGASGIVFGLFGALLTAGRRLGLNIGSLAGVVIINFALGFVIPGIAWQGHLGGFLAGAALGAVFTAGSRERQTAIHTAGVVTITLVLIGSAVAV